MHLSIHSIKQMSGATLYSSVNEQVLVTSAHFDTRKLTNDSLFVALTIGERDGHDFIEQAIQQGAKAVLVSKTCSFYDAYPHVAFLQVEDTLKAFQQLAHEYRKAWGKTVVAITGSNGKTTSKDIVAHLLSSKLSVHKTAGNYNNHIGVPLTLLEGEREHDVWVIEMGMNHAGEIDVLARIAEPNYAIITNIGESHIEYLGSREGIAHAKGELLPHLRSGGTAFIPYDCDFRELLLAKTNEKTVCFGIGSSENNPFLDATKMDWDTQEKILAHSIEVVGNQTKFEYGYSNFPGMNQFSLPLYGEHNVLNTLPAIYIADELGFSRKDIFDGLKDMVISPMRFQLMMGNNETTIINDAYNASPTSMKTSTSTFLTTFSSFKRVIVLGDMFELGQDAEQLHQEVGIFLNTYQNNIDFLVTIGETSRYLSGSFHGRKRHFSSKEKASAFLNGFLSPDFALFFKASRGMKLESIINTLVKEKKHV